MDKDTNKKIFMRKQLESVSKILFKNNFETYIFDDTQSATDYIISTVGKNKNIGIGGSVTITEIGLVAKLEKNGNKIFTHVRNMTNEQRRKVWLKAQNSDYYFASPQAITIKGEMIFLDANGNRVSSIIYGPKKVVLVAGYNKIVKDYNLGLWRARNISAIINNLRLNRKNPCIVTGKCEDCNSKERICNILTVLYKKPSYTDYIVILINEELGY